MASSSLPIIRSTSEVEITTATQQGRYQYHSFTYLKSTDEPWYGKITKKDAADMPTVDDINGYLRPVKEAYCYPEKPDTITIANPDLQNTYIKRPDFEQFNEYDPEFWARVLLHEALIMEQIPPHPNIVKYHGCRVRRGRVTGIVLERLESTLMQSPRVANIPAFLAELQSAVDYLHSLGLAHNDIMPHNIMIKHGHPVLIDFGGCAPPGDSVDFCGSPGWCEEAFFHSAMEHDTYAMDKLRTWLENGGKHESS